MGTRKTLLMSATSFLQRGSYLQLFAKLFVSLGFFVYLVRTTPFNSDRLDMLVCTSQFCILATLFFAIMMKIGFFEAEGISEELINNLLMGVMLLPMALALYIVGHALYEGLQTKCHACGRSTMGKLRRLGSYLASPETTPMRKAL